MAQIQFERGQFLPFRTLNKIHLGKYSFDLPVQADVTFDGVMLRYNGQEYEAPQLRGLVGSWIAPAGDSKAAYVAKPAGVEVRSSTTEGPDRRRVQMAQASEEESLVGTVDAAAARREQARQPQIPQQRRVAREEPPPPPVLSHSDAEAEPELEQALTIDETEYRPATPTTGGSSKDAPLSDADKRAVAEADALNRARIAKLAEQPVKKPVTFGGNRYDEADPSDVPRRAGKYAVVDVDGQEGVEIGRYQFSGGAAVGAEGEATASAKAVDVTKAGKPPVQVGNPVASTPRTASSGAQVIADPATIHEPQAARARSTTQIPAQGNVGIDAVYEGGGTGDVSEPRTGDELTDLLPDAEVAGLRREATGGTKKFAVVQRSEADEIQSIVDGWSTKRNWQVRVEEAVSNYGHWPEALEAIYAIESPAVVKNIKGRLAAAPTP